MSVINDLQGDLLNMTSERDELQEALVAAEARAEKAEAVHDGEWNATIALRAERDALKKELTDFREWPCESEGCKHDLASVDNHEHGGCWFCLESWNKAIGGLCIDNKALRAESVRLREVLEKARCLIAFVHCAEHMHDRALGVSAGCRLCQTLSRAESALASTPPAKEPTK